jgi:hypothetical protein
MALPGSDEPAAIIATVIGFMIAVSPHRRG